MTARIRMKYTKTGRIRFLSHLDFMTLVHRAAARAGIPLAWSQGFNPHPRIAFGPALPVGMESETEFLDLETDPFADTLEVTKALNKALPQGVRILEARIIPKKAPSLSGCIGRYRYEVSVQAAFVEGMEERVRDFLARPTIRVSKEGKEKDIRPGLESIFVENRVEGCVLLVTLVDQNQVKPRVQDVIEQLFAIGPDRSPLIPVKRCGLFYRDAGQWKSPLEVS
jgi:radical SAM-linked protein